MCSTTPLSTMGVDLCQRVNVVAVFDTVDAIGIWQGTMALKRQQSTCTDN